MQITILFFKDISNSKSDYLFIQKERDQESIQEKKKWDLLHRALEDPVKKKLGEKMAEQAHRRIVTKKLNYKSLRVSLTLHQC